MTDNELKQQEMEQYYSDLLSVILADGKNGLVPTLAPKFINCNYEEKSLTIEFKVNEWELNPEGILFGGLTVSMLDNAYGFLCHLILFLLSFVFLLNTDYFKKFFTTELKAVGFS